MQIESEIVLYMHEMSPFCRSVMCFLYEYDIPFSEVFIDFFSMKQHTPQYLKINPMGKVPAIKHNDFVLIESKAILMYLSRVFKKQEMYPTNDVFAAAEIDKILGWCMDNFDVEFLSASKLKFIYGILGVQIEEPEQQQIQKGMESLGILNKMLQGQFLVGQSPTIADFVVFCLVQNISYFLNFDLSALPNLNLWFQCINQMKGPRKANERFKEVMEKFVSNFGKI